MRVNLRLVYIDTICNRSNRDQVVEQEDDGHYESVLPREEGEEEGEEEEENEITVREVPGEVNVMSF